VGYPLLAFLFHYLLQSSLWTIVLVTLERLVTVMSPVKGKGFCTKQNAVIAWIATNVILIALNAHGLDGVAL
jgi:hypothetical protein